MGTKGRVKHLHAYLMGSCLACLWMALWSLPAVAATPANPEAVVENITNQVLSVLQANLGKTSTPQVKQRIDDIVLPHIDFMTMSRFVMSQYWQQMTPAQRDDFVQLFKDQLVHTYTDSLSHYRGQTVQLVSSRQISRNPPVAQVNTVIRESNGQADIPVTYALFWSGTEWKIYNVFIDGVSLDLNYRDSYGQIASHRGIADLLQEMKKKNAAWESRDPSR